MSKQVDFDKYQKFVDAVTSDASTDFVALSDRLVELDEKGANIERLLTAGVGINAEGGEFLEIIKKMIFQGKPWDEANKEPPIKGRSKNLVFSCLGLPTAACRYLNLLSSFGY